MILIFPLFATSQQNRVSGVSMQPWRKAGASRHSTRRMSLLLSRQARSADWSGVPIHF
jgi:hypothetical protein